MLVSDEDTGIFEERVRYGLVIRKAAPMNEEGRCIHYVCTHEEAERLIRTSSWFSISNCGCRESQGTCGRSRVDVCLSFDPDDRGSGSGARQASLEEALEVLAEARVKRLVTRPWRTADRMGTAGICNCCDDCCGYFLDESEKCDKGAMIESTDMARCTSCGLCEPACYFGARHVGEEALQVDRDRCYGCGLCRKACPEECITMVPRD